MPRGDKPTTVALALKDGWVYEDALPEMTKEQYDWWFNESLVLDGVRMGPPLTTNPTPEHKEQAQEIINQHSSVAFLSYLGQAPFNELVELVASALSSRDTEIREVLEGLQKQEARIVQSTTRPQYVPLPLLHRLPLNRDALVIINAQNERRQSKACTDGVGQ